MMQRLTLEADTSEKEAILFWVLDHYFDLSRTEIMAGKEIDADQKLIDDIIVRLNNNEPVQYILGITEFYGRDFIVGPGVLIPRPETELLIKTIVDRFKNKPQNLRILDIGTGNGCIAISLALELPGSKVIATDKSDEALKIARKNADQLKASIEFHRHDILEVDLTFDPLDIVVSNPPYVMEKEKISMERNVLDFEPSMALFVPDNDPLLFYKAIARKAIKSLHPGGFLITEINEQLGNDTAVLFQKHGFADVQIIKDLEARDRFVYGSKA
ncbi:MAG: peptide chain release factor N(5)-glutamine methyltransferase [Bacteroidota bacterium]